MLFTWLTVSPPRVAHCSLSITVLCFFFTCVPEFYLQHSVVFCFRYYARFWPLDYYHLLPYWNGPSSFLSFCITLKVLIYSFFYLTFWIPLQEHLCIVSSFWPYPCRQPCIRLHRNLSISLYCDPGYSSFDWQFVGLLDNSIFISRSSSILIFP